MSFSSDVKTELCEIRLPECSKMPICYGFLLFSRSFSVDGIKMQTETEAVASLFKRLISEVYSVSCVIKNGTGKKTVYCLNVANEAERLKLLASVDFGIHEGKINREILSIDCCKAAFIRGAFLACGQISSPEKGCRVDFLIRDKGKAEEFREFLRENYIETNLTKRQNGYVVYIKRNEMITNLLTLMGASIRSLELIENSILKSVKNNMNRARNCDNANLDRMVEASLKQRIAIEYLKESGVLEALPQELIKTAKLRQDNPEASIKELCRLAGGDISASGLNHRLKKLMDIYKEKAEK
ncbi:MAG: DNA-binding protein WhiA [Clostridia bacterium]|nr:DNA-binding protein WhiA [Clostridia bacterium]